MIAKISFIKTSFTVLKLCLHAFLVSIVLSETCEIDTGLCEFPKHACDDNLFKSELERLKPLIGKRYAYTEQSGAEYQVGICTQAISPDIGSPDDKDAVVQITNDKRKFHLGSLLHSSIKSGLSWIELEYEGGQRYGSHCGDEERRSIIMITCDPGKTEAELSLTNEYNNKTQDCFYLFELASDVACPDHSTSGLSIGSIVCIVFFSVVGVYLIGGMLYQRFVVGAKGMEQIPHYAFWQDFGNLQADGCDLVFRRGGSTGGSRQYRGIGDDQLQSQTEEADTDEHLLPM